MDIILFWNFIVVLRKLGFGCTTHKYKNYDETSAFDLFPQRSYLMVVPRRLFFAAQQRIAIAQSPKLHQKNQL
jgi:hypothetical protein